VQYVPARSSAAAPAVQVGALPLRTAADGEKVAVLVEDR
jgi:hypothetical protein